MTIRLKIIKDGKVIGLREISMFDNKPNEYEKKLKKKLESRSKKKK